MAAKCENCGGTRVLECPRCRGWRAYCPLRCAHLDRAVSHDLWCGARLSTCMNCNATGKVRCHLCA